MPCCAVLCCRYCFESDVPINMEGQEALLDWALLRMGLTGVCVCVCVCVCVWGGGVVCVCVGGGV
jgi:hypothetical protein